MRRKLGVLQTQRASRLVWENFSPNALSSALGVFWTLPSVMAWGRSFCQTNTANYSISIAFGSCGSLTACLHTCVTTKDALETNHKIAKTRVAHIKMADSQRFDRLDKR